MIDDSSPVFHGAGMGQGQDLSENDHPYLSCNKFVSVQTVRPGDADFWHCNEAHMVEGEDTGASNSSVIYVPVLPLCNHNAEYLRAQAAAFLNGTPPIHFPGGVGDPSMLVAQSKTISVRAVCQLWDWHLLFQAQMLLLPSRQFMSLLTRYGCNIGNNSLLDRSWRKMSGWR